MNTALFAVIGMGVSILLEVYKWLGGVKGEKFAGNFIRATVLGVSLFVSVVLATNIVSYETLMNFVTMLATAITFYEMVIKMFYKALKKH